MKTLVVGYGSIGKRHVKNLIGFNQTQVSVCSKNKEVLQLGKKGIKIFITINTNLDNPTMYVPREIHTNNIFSNIF